MTIKFQKLTRTNMRALIENQNISEHGIVFERLTNGDGRFLINIMVDGKRVHRVLGKESEGVTRQQAEEFIAKMRTDARHDRLNLPKGRKLTLSFEEAAEKYLEKLKEEDGKNISKKREQLKLHLVPFFKDKPLSQIVTFDIERYKKHRITKAKNGTINRELAVLSHLLNKAMEWKWIEFKACQIKRLKEDQGRITYLSAEKTVCVLESAKVDQNFHIYPFIMIGLETSMRRMEILSVELKNIDLQKRVIFIPQAKSGAREQPITNRLSEFLKSYVDMIGSSQQWLFPSKRSASTHVMNIEKACRRVVTRAGLNPKEIVRHTLRHTAITHLVQAGVDLPTVQRISGHKSLQMVVRYSHQNGSHIQAAMDKLEKRYELNPNRTTDIDHRLHNEIKN